MLGWLLPRPTSRTASHCHGSVIVGEKGGGETKDEDDCLQ